MASAAHVAVVIRMSDEYTPSMDEIRLAWWMTPDNPADNEGASDVSFDQAIAAHDAEVRADQIEKDAAIADDLAERAGSASTRSRTALQIAKKIRDQIGENK